jgi:hypothetical protein
MAGARWAVSCADHTVGGLASREAAERRLAEIVRLGACPLAHEIREVER